VEHRLARLVQLGIRQARYVGRAKVLFQLAMAAAVANLTYLATTTSAAPAPMAVVGALVVLAGLLLACWGDRPGRPAPSASPPRRASRPAATDGRHAPGLSAGLRMAGSRPGF
jgi:protein-S-isoprenylcysteine O-methyltransferase Ste14